MNDLKLWFVIAFFFITIVMIGEALKEDEIIEEEIEEIIQESNDK